MGLQLSDIIRGLEYDDNGKKKVLVAWGFPTNREYKLIGYDYSFSLVNNVEQVVVSLKRKLGEHSGEYLVYPVDDIRHGLELYRQTCEYLTGEKFENPENLGDVNEDSQVHLLIHRRGIYE